MKKPAYLTQKTLKPSEAFKFSINRVLSPRLDKITLKPIKLPQKVFDRKHTSPAVAADVADRSVVHASTSPTKHEKRIVNYSHFFHKHISFLFLKDKYENPQNNLLFICSKK